MGNWENLFFMGEIRLYRQIYCFQYVSTGVTSNTLINPIGISASTTTVDSSGSTIIETVIPVNESTGIFYADLDPTLYTGDVTYELNWLVEYTPGSPIRRLPTRFRINAVVVGHQIEIEILPNPWLGFIPG